MHPGTRTPLPAWQALALAWLVLPACAVRPPAAAAHGAAPAPGTAVSMMPAPARVPQQLCLDCGWITGMEPGPGSRWRFTLRMEDGTVRIALEDKTPRLVVGAQVRLTDGRLLPR